MIKNTHTYNISLPHAYEHTHAHIHIVHTYKARFSRLAELPYPQVAKFLGHPMELILKYETFFLEIEDFTNGHLMRQKTSFFSSLPYLGNFGCYKTG